MIHDLLTEYAKVQDWFITKYLGKELTQSVRYNQDEERFEVTLSFPDYDGTIWSYARYVEKKWLKTDYYNFIKAGILTRNQRLIEEKLGGT